MAQKYENPLVGLSLNNRELASAHVREIRKASDVVIPGLHPASQEEGHWYIHSESVYYIVIQVVDVYFSQVSSYTDSYKTPDISISMMADSQGGPAQPSVDLTDLSASSFSLLSISDVVASSKFSLLSAANMPSSWMLMGHEVVPQDSTVGMYRARWTMAAHSHVVEDPTSIHALWIPAAANLPTEGVKSTTT